jgi:polyferredoxin
VLGVLIVLSIFYQNFWCRYLCPYGALLGLLGRFSPTRVRRDPEICIDCAKCAKACPSLLPVDQLLSVRSPECTGCYDCIAICPAEGALWMSAAGRRRRLPAWAMAAAIAVLFLGTVGFARLIGRWDTSLPDRVYYQLVPRAHEFTHP